MKQQHHNINKTNNSIHHTTQPAERGLEEFGEQQIHQQQKEKNNKKPAQNEQHTKYNTTASEGLRYLSQQHNNN